MDIVHFMRKKDLLCLKFNSQRIRAGGGLSYEVQAYSSSDLGLTNVILYHFSSTMLSEIQVRPVRHHVHVNSNSGVILDTRDSGSEKWRTKKKVEIVTTKNVEKTIKRQLVLEDGRVLDEDIPIVTLDTTENKEIFETDHDEERDNRDYNKRAEMNTGDKVMTLKTTKDVKENVTKTEASHNIGSIANRVSIDVEYQ